MGGTVTIEGLRDFHRALRELDKKFPKALRDANFDLASEVVKRSKARGLTEGGVARKASKSLRAARSANSSVVTGGGPGYPYFFGAEFGAKQYRQFETWRGNQWEGWDGGPGYFLHPVIRSDARELVAAYMKRLDALADEAFS